MSNEASKDLAHVNAGDREDDLGVESSFKALKLSNPTALRSKPCVSPPAKIGELDEHARDSGYGSATSTPDPKDTAIPRQKPGQIPLILQTGLCVSNKAMEPETKRRFVEVQLEIERMLLEFMRKLKSGPGRYKPIAIRPMMLGKTDSDLDARSYMVVICSENIKRKVQDFFDEPLVKSLCEPGDDDTPSFKALVIGHALRLRASTSDIAVQCRALKDLYHSDGAETFCGMPIRLCDELGHARNATFGGVVKVTSTDGGYCLYGITAGHLVKDHQVVADDNDACLYPINSDLASISLSEEAMQASQIQTRETSQEMNNMEQHEPENSYFRNEDHLGNVLNMGGRETLMDEDQRQRPYLDWALFELNVLRPNQFPFHSDGRKHPKGDLRLPLSTNDSIKDEVSVSMLCASQGVKRGVLSTTRARVLLNLEESFTDAYTLSLDSSEVSDGDSGSWVVDDSRLEVYGHVVADDVFGDAYVIPMTDILADIRRCLGANSVDLPTGLDIFSDRLKRFDLLSEAQSRDRPRSQSAGRRLEDLSQFSRKDPGIFLASQRLQAAMGMASADPGQGPRPSLSRVDVPPWAADIAQDATIINFPQRRMRRPHPDSGYSSLHVTPNTSPPPPIAPSGLQKEDASNDLDSRLTAIFESADRRACGQLTDDETLNALRLLFERRYFSLSTVKSLHHILPQGADRIRIKEFAYISNLLLSWKDQFCEVTTSICEATRSNPDDFATNSMSNHMNLQEFSIALSASNYRLNSEFVKVLFESVTGKRRVFMDLEEFLDACIKLKRM